MDDSNPITVTTTEAAEILGVSRRTVQRLVWRGDLVPIRGDVAGYLFRRGSVKKFAKEGAA